MKYCKNCGEKLDDDARFCPNCGEEVNSEGVSSKSEEKSLSGFGIGFVLSFFLGVIGFILSICLGDEKCKKGSIYGLITIFIILFVFVILSFIFRDYLFANIFGRIP